MPPPLPPRGVGTNGHVPGSRSAWGLCSQQHTAHGSNRWAVGPCTGHSHWHRQFASLSGRGQDEVWEAAWAPALPSITFWGDPLPQGRHLRPGIHPSHVTFILPSPASIRLTALTILGTFSPAVGGFTSWRTGLAWGESRKTVRETEIKQEVECTVRERPRQAKRTLKTDTI